MGVFDPLAGAITTALESLAKPRLRRTVAQLSLAFFSIVYFIVAMIAPPGLTGVFGGLFVCYLVAFLANHGRVLTALRRLPEGEAVLVEALGILEKALPDEDRQVQITLRRIVDLYETWEKPVKARAYRSRLISTEEGRSNE